MTWLRSIATRTAIDHWRREQKLQLVDNEHDEADMASVPAMDAENRDLELAIQQLPPQARAVFILFALEGYQHNEISGLLGIAEGSSKAQYHRARTLLREFLGEQ